MPDYLYSLIRYVPDLDRMEPVNVGVILQGTGRVEVRFSPHAAKRADIDTERFRQWKDFFIREVNGEASPLFQPPKDEPAYLEYLQELCKGSVLMSRSLALVAAPSRDFDDVFSSIYRRLVMRPDDPEPVGQEKRPTSLFRRLSDEKRFSERGMKGHAHLVIDEASLWIAYRQVQNGELIAMDKVEDSRRLGQTCNEIERLATIIKHLAEFLKSRLGQPTRYYFLADELTVPFANQGQRDFDLLRKDLDVQLREIKNLGGTVLRSPAEVQSLVAELDGKLPSPAVK